MRVDLTIPYRFTCRRKGARKDDHGWGRTTVPVEIPVHAGAAPVVGRFGMPGREERLAEAGVLRQDPDDRRDDLKAVFSAIDGRPRTVVFFDNDFWVEIGSTADIQERLDRRGEEDLDPFAVSRGDTFLFYDDGKNEDPDALRASGQIKTIVASEIHEYKALASDRARLDLRIVGGMVVMRTAEPVVAALQHMRHGQEDKATYEIVVVPSSDTTSTGFKFLKDVGRTSSFGTVPLHRKEDVVAEVRESADKLSSEGGKRTVVHETGSWRNRRRRRVEEKFAIEAMVLDLTVTDVERPDLLAYDDFAKKAKSGAWALTCEIKNYLRHMAKPTGLALVRLMDAREASRGLATPRLVRALREASESLVDGTALTIPRRVPGGNAVNVYGYHAIDEESGKFAEIKSTAGEVLDAFEMRVPGRDWFDHALDAAADFRDGFTVYEICALTGARRAAAALGAPEISDLALEAARGEGHLVCVRRGDEVQGVLHVAGPADVLEVREVFARPGFHDLVDKAAAPFLDRIRTEASVEADLDLGLDAPAFA